MRFAVLLFGLAGLATAQRSQVAGQVTDPTGQSVAGASVVVVNEATKARRETSTNAEGLYTVPTLTPGPYTLRVTKEGFKASGRTGVVLTVDTGSRVDVRLEIGTVSESINVTENVGVLQVESPEISTTITQDQVQNLPLVQLGRVRVAAAFIYLTAGVQGNVRIDGQDNLAASNQIRVQAAGRFNMSSGWTGCRRVRWDRSATSTRARRQWKRCASSSSRHRSWPPSMATSAQAVTSFSLKSGTNRLHGSAFEYLRNDKLDARSWFAADRAITRQNEFGATVGGPVWLPKLYDGRDRSFFFFSWTSSRRRGLDNFSRVQIPTPANVAGDFSNWRNAAGNVIPIYDPATTTAAASGGFTRTAFPGNRIPPARLDPVATKIAAFYPSPNATGSLNYAAFIGEKRLDPDIFTARGDHSLSTNHKLFFSFNSTDIPRFRIDTPLPDPLIAGILQNITSQLFRLGYDAVLRPNLLNSFIAGVNLFRNPVDPVTAERGWPARLGWTGVTGDRFPVLSFGDGYVGAASGGITDNNDNVHMVKDTVSWTRGRSNWRFGGEYRWNHLNNRALTNTQGSLSFNNLATALPGSPAGSGNSVASFLLGEVASGNARLPQVSGIRRSYWGFFAQNDFKVSRKLTLT